MMVPLNAKVVSLLYSNFLADMLFLPLIMTTTNAHAVLRYFCLPGECRKSIESSAGACRVSAYMLSAQGGRCQAGAATHCNSNASG